MGGSNTLVLGLRQSENGGAVLEGIEIVPYYEDAEIRIKTNDYEKE